MHGIKQLNFQMAIVSHFLILIMYGIQKNLRSNYNFLSLQNGFGIPVLEALVCRAKIIASNRILIPETVGNCVIKLLFKSSGKER